MTKEPQSKVAAAVSACKTRCAAEAKTVAPGRLFGFWISHVYAELGYVNVRPPLEIREAASTAVRALIPSTPLRGKAK